MTLPPMARLVFLGLMFSLGAVSNVFTGIKCIVFDFGAIAGEDGHGGRASSNGSRKVMFLQAALLCNGNP